MKNRALSQACFYLSVIAAIVAVIDSFKVVDVWLSATSWLVIAAVLGIWAIYLSSEICCSEKRKEE